MKKFFDLIDVFPEVKSQLTALSLAAFDVLAAFDLVHVTDEQFLKINALGGALFAFFVALKVQRNKAS